MTQPFGDFLGIRDKVFLVTGASSGIGRSISRTCYEFGAKLVLMGRNAQRMAETTEQMSTDSFHTILVDLSEPETMEAAIAEAVSRLGKIDGFCHSAGYEKTLSLQAMKPVHYQSMYNVNAVAGFELARLLSKKKYCSEQGSSFVFISSITSLVSRVGLTAYSASKGAIVSASKALALELAAKNTRVNCISPGTVITPLIENFLNQLEPEQRQKRLDEYPLGLGQPEDIANLVAYLFSPRSRWITGSNIVIDGGYTSK
ncbi:MAG: SDR family oxidoreductase [Proteiniphilum sp.]|nr:SDR family oxidoreductase [Proteiniphilum sp.]